MSRTNLEFLFQVAAPTSDRGFCTLPRAEELFPPFGDHLSKATSTTAGELGISARREDPNNGPAGGKRSENTSSTNGKDSRTESSQSNTSPVAHEATTDRDESEADESQSSEISSETGTNNSEIASAEILKPEQDGEAEDDKSEELDEAPAVAVEVNLNKIAVIAATNDTLPETDVAAEGEIQHEAEAGDLNSKLNPEHPATGLKANATLTEEFVEKVKQVDLSADPIDSSTIAKPVKTVRPAKAVTEKAKHESNCQPVEPTQNSDVSDELSGSPLESVETSKQADESSNGGQSLNELEQANDSQSGADEPRRDASARSSTRQRVEAETIVNKIATTAVANAVAPHPRDDGAVSESTDRTAPTTSVGALKTEMLADAANRLQSNHRSAKGDGRTDGANEMPRVDPARFVGRVAKAFHTAQERGGSLQLRLSPPELGAMRLELTVKDGVMTAALETETNAARRVLLEHLPALRDRLAEQNIRIERFDVDVRREGSGGQADPRAPQDRQPQQQGHPERRQPAMQPRESAAPRSFAPIALPLTDNPGINLVA